MNVKTATNSKKTMCSRLTLAMQYITHASSSINALNASSKLRAKMSINWSVPLRHLGLYRPVADELTTTLTPTQSEIYVTLLWSIIYPFPKFGENLPIKVFELTSSQTDG